MRSEEGVLGVSERDRGEEDATKRTYLAQERTLLAWWRSGLAAFAVAIGIGRLVPAILDVAAAPFVALGVGFGTLGLAFVSIGAYRDRAVTRHLAQGRFDPLDSRVVLSITVVLLVLGAVSVGSLAPRGVAVSRVRCEPSAVTIDA